MDTNELAASAAGAARRGARAAARAAGAAAGLAQGSLIAALLLLYAAALVTFEAAVWAAQGLFYAPLRLGLVEPARRAVADARARKAAVAEENEDAVEDAAGARPVAFLDEEDPALQGLEAKAEAEAEAEAEERARGWAEEEPVPEPQPAVVEEEEVVVAVVAAAAPPARAAAPPAPPGVFVEEVDAEGAETPRRRGVFSGAEERGAPPSPRAPAAPAPAGGAHPHVSVEPAGGQRSLKVKAPLGERLADALIPGHKKRHADAEP
jgi:hypothetical protein